MNNRPFEKDVGEQGNSQVRVPFDAEKQTVDHSLQLPRTDEKIGVTEVWTFTTEVVAADKLKDDPAIAVYLPYGYDAEREEPYKVMYISHGAGTESESSYYNKGSMVNITDNLIAEGLVEPLVIVIINNFSTGFSEDSFMADIVPLVEEKYNVRKDADGKCVCGLSAGSSFTRRVMAKYPAEFGHYGVFSGGGDFGDPAKLADAKIYFGNAYFDFLYGSYKSMAANLTAVGLSYDEYVIDSGHIWDLWRQIYVDYLTNFLWKQFLLLRKLLCWIRR